MLIGTVRIIIIGRRASFQGRGRFPCFGLWPPALFIFLNNATGCVYFIELYSIFNWRYVILILILYSTRYISAFCKTHRRNCINTVY